MLNGRLKHCENKGPANSFSLDYHQGLRGHGLGVTAGGFLSRNVPVGVIDLEMFTLDRGRFHMQRQVPDTLAHSFMSMKPLIFAQTSGGRPPAEEYSMQVLVFVSSLTGMTTTMRTQSLVHSLYTDI